MSISIIEKQIEESLAERLINGKVLNEYMQQKDILISKGFPPVTLESIRNTAKAAGFKGIYFMAGGKTWNQ